MKTFAAGIFTGFFIACAGATVAGIYLYRKVIE